MKINTLNKYERLKSRKAIEVLMREADSFYMFPIRVLYRFHKDESTEPLKICVSVSKRRFKHAVDRNRIKRLMREAWRTNKLILTDELRSRSKQLDVMLIYTSKEIEDFKKVDKKTILVLNRLIEIVQQTEM